MAKASVRYKKHDITFPNAEPRYEFSVVRENKISGLTFYLPMLERLAKEAVEPNVFYEPWMLLPALERYATTDSMVFILVMATDLQQGSRCLCGFFPMVENRFYRGLSLRNFTLWHYPHCYLATPLMHREFASQALHALLAWFRLQRHSSLMVLNQFSAHGSFHNHLSRALAAYSVQTFEQTYERAFFHPDKDAATYLAKILSSKSRKEYRRLRRRLSEQGEMKWQELASVDSVDAWINEFLLLEASGWKGRSGTALLSSTADKTFFSHIAAEAFKRGRLLMFALRLDNQAIAMTSLLLCGRGGYAFKIAYDENYQYYAPGVLLIIELIKRLYDREDFHWLDSCSTPDNTLVNRLCPDRKRLCNMIVAKPYSLGGFVLKLLPLLMHLKKWLVQR